jgi:hypothetical protein
MQACATCGNEYDKPMEIKLGGQSWIFDSFECAITKLAPVCPHCDCRIIGHGVQAGGAIFCCAHCAEGAGEPGLRDRVSASS